MRALYKFHVMRTLYCALMTTILVIASLVLNSLSDNIVALAASSTLAFAVAALGLRAAYRVGQTRIRMRQASLSR